MKVCLVCSAGGHLSELMQLKKFYSGYEHFYLTFRRPDSEGLAEKENVFFVSDPARNPLKFVLNFFQSLKIFLTEKPDVIISTGAGVALGEIFTAKLFRKKIVFVESFCRISSPSVTARIVYPFADLFFVQWKQNLRFFPKAIYAGSVF